MLLLRLCKVLVHEGRRIAVLVMCELRSIGVLLSVRVGDGVIHGASHGDLVGQVGVESPVEVDGSGLKMGSEPAILHGQVVVFLLIHLLVDNILLGHAQRAACASLVDFRCSTC